MTPLSGVKPVNVVLLFVPVMSRRCCDDVVDRSGGRCVPAVNRQLVGARCDDSKHLASVSPGVMWIVVMVAMLYAGGAVENSSRERSSAMFDVVGKERKNILPAVQHCDRL